MYSNWTGDRAVASGRLWEEINAGRSSSCKRNIDCNKRLLYAFLSQMRVSRTDSVWVGFEWEAYQWLLIQVWLAVTYEYCKTGGCLHKTQGQVEQEGEITLSCIQYILNSTYFSQDNCMYTVLRSDLKCTDITVYIHIIINRNSL